MTDQDGRSPSRSTRSEMSGCNHKGCAATPEAPCFCGCHRAAKSLLIEWGYRLSDDPYVVVMPSEDMVRQFVEGSPSAVVVRRFIGAWEPVDA